MKRRNKPHGPPFRAAVRAATLLLSAHAAAAAPVPDAVHDYDGCTQLVERNAELALERALGWEQAGGGNAARHCAALALAAVGDFAAAADQLESLAWDLPPDAPDAERAAILAQSGQFWLDAGQPAKADAVLSAAVDLAPQDAEIRIDRAMVYAAMNRLQDAIVDLSASILLSSTPREALVLRASAYRQTGRLREAGDDLERALAGDPIHPGALLERGLLRRQLGDEAGARADWELLLARHPESAAAAAARRHLKQPAAADAPKGR